MGKILNEALSFKYLESDPKIRVRATKEYRTFKHMALNTIVHMVFDGIHDRDTK